MKKYQEFSILPLSFHEFNVDGGANDITFSVTEDCNLRCKYCYLVHKNSTKKMSFETAKKAVDYVLSARDIYNEKSVVWSFIGGEPTLEMDLIDKISDYIKEQMYLTNHPWLDNYMFSIGTNGILYHTKKVQDYIAKNRDHLSVAITVDGNKIKHDLQRVYPDGKGSYDDVVKNVPLWLEQFPGATTKATFSKGDLPYLKDSIIHLWNLGIKNIPCNVVFEDVWDENDPIIFEDQLRQLADYIVENDVYLDKENGVQFFSPLVGFPLSEEDKLNKFCGAGKMLAIDCDGRFFPCIRFTDFSMTKKQGLCIGDVDTGVLPSKMKPFESLSVCKMSSQECLDCEVASGCRTCTGLCYDESETGSIYHRTVSHCEMQKANVRAINYLWQKIAEKTGNSETIRAKKQNYIKSKHNKYLLIYTSDKEVPHCVYKNKTNQELNQEKASCVQMSDSMIERALDFAEKNNLKPIFIGGSNYDKPSNKFTRILNYKDINGFKTTNSKDMNQDILVFDNAVDSDYSSKTAILLIDKNNIGNISEFVIKLFSKCKAKHVDVMLRDIEFWEAQDLQEYENQLELISEFIFDNYDFDNFRYNFSVNVLDKNRIKKLKDCGAGKSSYTLAPNGKLYLCPAFYFEDEEKYYIGDLDNGFNYKYQQEIDLQESDCKDCKNLHCKRCVYLNKKLTNEYSISPEIQCRISNIEGQVADKLNQKINQKIKELKEEINSI